MGDRFGDGRQFRLLNLLHALNREGLCMAVKFSLPAERVIQSLDRIIERRGMSLSRFGAASLITQCAA